MGVQVQASFRTKSLTQKVAVMSPIEQSFVVVQWSGHQLLHTLCLWNCLLLVIKTHSRYLHWLLRLLCSGIMRAGPLMISHQICGAKLQCCWVCCVPVNLLSIQLLPKSYLVANCWFRCNNRPAIFVIDSYLSNIVQRLQSCSCFCWEVLWSNFQFSAIESPQHQLFGLKYTAHVHY